MEEKKTLWQPVFLTDDNFLNDKLAFSILGVIPMQCLVTKLVTWLVTWLVIRLVTRPEARHWKKCSPFLTKPQLGIQEAEDKNKVVDGRTSA